MDKLNFKWNLKNKKWLLSLFLTLGESKRRRGRKLYRLLCLPNPLCRASRVAEDHRWWPVALTERLSQKASELAWSWADSVKDFPDLHLFIILNTRFYHRFIHWNCHHFWKKLTAFGVFRRPPWKELSCKPQTALAQAQQEGFLCITLCLCIRRLLCKTALCVKDGFDTKALVWFKPRIKFKPKHVCKIRVVGSAILRKAVEKVIFKKVLRVNGVRYKRQWI